MTKYADAATRLWACERLRSCPASSSTSWRLQDVARVRTSSRWAVSEQDRNILCLIPTTSHAALASGRLLYLPPYQLQHVTVPASSRHLYSPLPHPFPFPFPFLSPFSFSPSLFLPFRRSKANHPGGRGFNSSSSSSFAGGKTGDGLLYAESGSLKPLCCWCVEGGGAPSLAAPAASASNVGQEPRPPSSM